MKMPSLTAENSLSPATQQYVTISCRMPITNLQPMLKVLGTKKFPKQGSQQERNDVASYNRDLELKAKQELADTARVFNNVYNNAVRRAKNLRRTSGRPTANCGDTDATGKIPGGTLNPYLVPKRGKAGEWKTVEVIRKAGLNPGPSWSGGVSVHKKDRPNGDIIFHVK